MSNSLLSGFTDADSEDDEILEMSSGSTLFPVNTLYQSGSFSSSSLLPTSPPQQITPTTMPILPQTVPTISPVLPQTVPTTTPITPTPLMSPITTAPLQQTPQVFSSIPITPAQPMRAIPVQPAQSNLQHLQAQQLQAQLTQTQQLQTQIQVQQLQTQQLQQQIRTQQTQGQPQGQTQGQIQTQGPTQGQIQTQAQTKITAATLPQLKHTQGQIIYRLQQLKQLIQQATIQKNSDPSASSSSTTTTTTTGTDQSTTPQSTTSQSTNSATPSAPIPLVSGGPGKPGVPLHTMLPQLLQQQQALVQKYHQTQQQIQALSGAPSKPAASATPPTAIPSVINTQKQIALVYQKLQEVSHQLQVATKLPPPPSAPSPSPSPSSSSTPTNPTILALQKQQQLLARQYQQLLQLQSKTPPPPSPNPSAPLTVTPLPSSLAVPSLSSSLTIPTTSIAPSLVSNGAPTSPTAATPLALLQMNAALHQTTSLAPSSLSTNRIENTTLNTQNALLSSSTASSSTSSSSSSTSADVVWSLHDQARLQRALVKYGTNFSVLSTAMGSKTSGQVRKFYHQSGGAKGSYRFYLAEHHRLKKNEGILDAYSLDLTEEEEGLVKQGKLPEMNPLSSSQTLASSSSSFSALPPLPVLPASSTSELTPPPDALMNDAPAQEKDPLEGMDDGQKKEYKRKRAEQIFAANDRGIFQTNEEGETDVHSPKKARRPLKPGQGTRENSNLPPRTNSAKSLIYKKIDPGNERQ